MYEYMNASATEHRAPRLPQPPARKGPSQTWSTVWSVSHFPSRTFCAGTPSPVAPHFTCIETLKLYPASHFTNVCSSPSTRCYKVPQTQHRMSNSPDQVLARTNEFVELAMESFTWATSACSHLGAQNLCGNSLLSMSIAAQVVNTIQ